MLLKWSDEAKNVFFPPILLKWSVNVASLNLYNNNFKVLPECLSEHHHLRGLVLDDCKFLEEIRGFPPNLREFSAIGCVSLSLESRRRLLSQVCCCFILQYIVFRIKLSHVCCCFILHFIYNSLCNYYSFV